MRRRFAALVAALVVTALLAPAAVARPGQELDPSQYDGEIAQLREQIGHASAEETAALDELAAVQDRRVEAESRLAEAQTRVDEATAALAAAQEEYDRVAAAYFAAEAELEETERKLAAAEAEYQDAVVELYTGSEGLDFATVASGANDVRELIAGTQYVTTISGNRRDTVTGYVDRRDEIAALRDELGIRRDEAQALQDELGTRQAELAAVRDEQVAAVADVDREIAAEERVVTSIRARKDEFETELDALEAESDRIAELIRQQQAAAAAAAPPPPASSDGGGGTSTAPGGPSGGGGSGQFMRPVAGPVSSGFGWRVHPITGSSRHHDGVDFSASCGTPIAAAGSGTVIMAGWYGGYGNAVIVDHGGGISTLYAHQAGFAVGGGSVGAGQTVGYVGSTGASTGCHLHWEVRINGTPVNPLAYL